MKQQQWILLVFMFTTLVLSVGARAAGKAEADGYCDKASSFSKEDCRRVADMKDGDQGVYFSAPALNFCDEVRLDKNHYVGLHFDSECIEAIVGKSYSEVELSKLRALHERGVRSYAITEALKQMGRPFKPFAPKRFDEPYTSGGFNAVSANTPYAVEQIRQGALKETNERLVTKYKSEVDAYFAKCTEAGGQPTQDLSGPSCVLHSDYSEYSKSLYSYFACGAAVVLRCE